MLDLTKKGKNLPDTIEVFGNFYKIKTDFRNWLVFDQMIKENHQLSDFDIFYYFDDTAFKNIVPPNKKEGIKKLFEFYMPHCTLPRAMGGNSTPVTDFFQDSDFIYSAFYQCYKIDLLETDLHWHKFLTLFRGLNNTRYNDIIQARGYTKNKDKDLIKLRQAWELETPQTQEEQQALEAFNALF